MKLKPNQMKFNDSFIGLMNKHGVSDKEALESIRALFPKLMTVHRVKKIPKVKKFVALDEVNKFIKDKTLRGSGVTLVPLNHEMSVYIVNYYEPV